MPTAPKGKEKHLQWTFPRGKQSLPDRSSHIVENSSKSQKVIDVWFCLLYDILSDANITERFWNILKLVMGNGEPFGEVVIANLPKR